MLFTCLTLFLIVPSRSKIKTLISLTPENLFVHLPKGTAPFICCCTGFSATLSSLSVCKNYSSSARSSLACSSHLHRIESNHLLTNLRSFLILPVLPGFCTQIKYPKFYFFLLDDFPLACILYAIWKVLGEWYLWPSYSILCLQCPIPQVLR